ncbi:MAG: Fur family transcriptional regulator [Candidatus Cryptobacteroides sp.]
MERPMHRVPSVEELKVILKRHGLKATQQRIAVHRAIMSLGHASADMIAEEIDKENTTKVTPASVYNILTQMSALGIYGRRLSANNKMYFDINSFSHIHLYDAENNTFKDIIDDELMDIVKARLGRKKFKGYRVEDIDIQIVCRPSKGTRPARRRAL